MILSRSMDHVEKIVECSLKRSRSNLAAFKNLISSSFLSYMFV